MKTQEAIENLKYLISGDCTDSHMGFVEEIEMAINALEKRTPKKPTVTTHKYRQANIEELKEYKLTHCPYCFWDDEELGYFDSLVDKGTKYCRRCGQALDWSANRTEEDGEQE